MPRVTLTGNLRQVVGGESEIEVEAETVRQLFTALGERYPALKPHLDAGPAVAIDGQIYQDAWLQPIPPDAEVHIMPQIAGG